MSKIILTPDSLLLGTAAQRALREFPTLFRAACIARMPGELVPDFASRRSDWLLDQLLRAGFSATADDLRCLSDLLWIFIFTQHYSNYGLKS